MICNHCNKEKQGVQTGLCNHCGRFGLSDHEIYKNRVLGWWMNLSVQRQKQFAKTFLNTTDTNLTFNQIEFIHDKIK